MRRQVAAAFKNATIVAVVALAACSTQEVRQSATASQMPRPDQVASVASPPTTTPLRAPDMRDSNWEYAGTNAAGTYDMYVDASSIIDYDLYRYTWAKILYRTEQRDKSGTPYASTADRIAFHCGSSMWSIVTFVRYSQDGSIVYTSPIRYHFEWKYTTADSMGEAIWRFVCQGERPEPPAPVVNSRKPELSLIEVQPYRSGPPLSPANIFKTVKSSVWILISFNLKYGKPDLNRGNQGSAVAIGPTTLLTNCHTLAGHSIHGIIQTETDRVMPVKIVKADYAGDRCILEAPSRLPSHVQIKPYNLTDIGEEAYSIGAPAGLELTMANGIISAKRNIKGVRYLQTTAPISPGSSGGGLFDCNGMLIGITTMFREDGQNLNFAIAADAF